MTQNSSPEGTKTIYLIRHGQTDFNKRGIIQGSGVDTDLNDTGRTQAEQFYRHYHHIPFSRIYVSSLKRTHQTVEPFLKHQQKAYTIIPELNEINWGIMEGMVPTPESTTEFAAIVKTWRNGNLDVAVEGGETPNQLQRRQQSGLFRLESDWPGSPVLICMHGRAMRSFLCLLTGHPLNLMDDFEHGNVCVYMLEKHKDEAYYRILLRNSRTHLHESVL